MPLPWLDPQHIEFPDTSQALADPNGLLAAGGALTPAWLEAAYRRGIFPWYEEGQPILWWTPDPRLVLSPAEIHISRSLRKFLRRQTYRVTLDTAFAEVVSACAAPRPDSPGTWITDAMQRAYCTLHRQGLAHSVEVWSDSTLVGGAYGVALGRMYFGESMFSHRDNTSKLALVYLCKQLQSWGFDLIDCQVRSEHLLSLGAFEISRREFETRLAEMTALDPVLGQWQLDPQLDVIGNAIE